MHKIVIVSAVVAYVVLIVSFSLFWAGRAKCKGAFEVDDQAEDIADFDEWAAEQRRTDLRKSLSADKLREIGFDVKEFPGKCIHEIPLDSECDECKHLLCR